MLSLGGNEVILPRCIYEHFQHCDGTTSGNFKFHEKQDKKSMFIKWKKKKLRKNKKSRVSGKPSEVYYRGRELQMVI